MWQLPRNMVKETNVLIIEPPNLFPPDTQRRPNGALGPPCLAGALKQAGFGVEYLDAAVGPADKTPQEIFFRQESPNVKGLVRVGMREDEIRAAVGQYALVLLSNIFTPQTNTSLEMARIVREENPEAVLLAGGINAWSLPDRFLDAGVDAIGLGEGEQTVVQVANAIADRGDWRETPGLIVRDEGKNKITGIPVPVDLDRQSPAYEVWPLNKYWEISSPHGGDFPPGMEVRYGSMETSRGCPFWCDYCHISSLKKDKGQLGPIGNLRLKSHDTVMKEAESLKELGVEWLFFEDDSLLAKPERAMKIFRGIKDLDLKLAGLNGVNLVHLFKRANSGGLEVHKELLETMAEAGFKQFVLPFESGNQRIIDKYASGKWNLKTMDVAELVRVAIQVGLKVPGNFMIGFPDETYAELGKTVDLAKRLVQAGLTYASFFIVVPYPGSTLYDQALANGMIKPDFDPDVFHWGNPVMSGTIISPNELIRIRKEAWKEVNDPTFVTGKLERMVVPEKMG